MLRLFVAIELPTSVQSALGEIQQRLRAEPGLAPLRWVRPQGIHLTLKFLGATPPEKRGPIEGALGRAVKGVAPFGLALGRLGRFGSRGSPRVLWVDVAGETGGLAHLQRRIEAEIAPLGFPPEDRPFAAHLTLARVPPERSREAGPVIESAIASVDSPRAEFAVSEVALMKSDLRPGGAVYTQLFTARLG